MKFADGECGFLERSRAERMLQGSPQARAFLETIKTVSSETQSELRREVGSVDLWARVSQRIESEEHAALFLGKREVPAASWHSRLGDWVANRWTLGISGAAVTAAIAFLAIVPASLNKFAPSGVSDRMVSMVRGVSLDVKEGSRPHGRPQVLEDDGPNVVEVDWMRSDGRVRMMPSPSRRSTIIWVKKRGPEQTARQGVPTPSLVDQFKPFSLAAPGR